MFEASVDPSLNLLRVGFSGAVNPAEAARCAESVQHCLEGLNPGFRLLTDLSGLEAMDYACMPQIKRMMDLCDQHGVAQIVRIIPDARKDIGFSILSLFHYRRRHLRIQTCKTMAEAMAALAGH